MNGIPIWRMTVTSNRRLKKSRVSTEQTKPSGKPRQTRSSPNTVLSSAISTRRPETVTRWSRSDMTRGKNRRLRLIPSHLPLIRDKLAEYERVALKEEMAAHSQYERSMEAAWNFADNLAVAQLWWISRDMTALAEDTVRAGDFPKLDAPAQSGLIFFDGDVQTVTFPVTDDATGRKVGDAHVSALFWQCDGNGDIELMGFTDHPCALKECDAKSFSLPVIRFANGIFNEHVGGFRWFGDLLYAVWALSAEPHICEAKPAKPDMAHPLSPRFDPEIRKVKMLVLRENLHRPGGSADDDERVRREYSHRFIVRGFWRDQAYGPNHSLRRRQWIPPFVKGPADKPLICKETVRIWKR
nr:MAG TPA: hypothetical protein [Caudoviricetes sp.]